MVEKSAVSVPRPSEKGDWRQMLPMKVSTTYDSEGSVFTNKISARLLNGFAKLKASFERSADGDFSYPLIGLVNKYLSVLYDHEDQNALVTVSSANILRHLELKYTHDIKAERGEVTGIVRSSHSSYKAEVAYDVSQESLPKAIFTFPVGEIKVEEEFQEDDKRSLAVSGFLAGSALSGLFVADYREENVNLKYTFKDEFMTLTPSLQLPSNAVALAFKRQFDAANKLSYRYSFDSTSWSTVYKHRAHEDLKIKLGYDSEVRLFWGSLWVGKEDAGAKQAPRKCKLQVMLQVPQDDIPSSAILLKVKKRWDL